MLRKCDFCDDKNEKSIDTSENRYVIVGTKAYHFDCYKIYLMTRKKNRLMEEDAMLECLRLEEITKTKVIELELKEKFFRMLMDYYKVPLPNHFFIKVDSIVNGKYKGISNPISYSELLDMYSNQKMLQRLEKLGYDKGIKKEDRIHWDLGVMVNEYPKYVKAKLKNKSLQQDAVEAIENIKKYKTDKSERYKKDIEDSKEKNTNETKIDDIVNDLFGFD